MVAILWQNKHFHFGISDWITVHRPIIHTGKYLGCGEWLNDILCAAMIKHTHAVWYNFRFPSITFCILCKRWRSGLTRRLYIYCLHYGICGCDNIILNTNTILRKCVYTPNDWVKWAFFITNKNLMFVIIIKWMFYLYTQSRWLEV